MSMADYIHLADTVNLGGIDTFIKNITTVIIRIAGLTATLFFVTGGVKYIVSSGNPMQLERAKKTILYAAIGLVIAVASFALSAAVSGIASSSFGS